jgi:hypothetical protein
LLEANPETNERGALIKARFENLAIGAKENSKVNLYEAIVMKQKLRAEKELRKESLTNKEISKIPSISQVLSPRTQLNLEAIEEEDNNYGRRK